MAAVGSTAEGKAGLGEMYSKWPFFGTNIGETQTELAASGFSNMRRRLSVCWGVFSSPVCSGACLPCRYAAPFGVLLHLFSVCSLHGVSCTGGSTGKLGRRQKTPPVYSAHLVLCHCCIVEQGRASRLEVALGVCFPIPCAPQSDAVCSLVRICLMGRPFNSDGLFSTRFGSDGLSYFDDLYDDLFHASLLPACGVPPFFFAAAAFILKTCSR